MISIRIPALTIPILLVVTILAPPSVGRGTEGPSPPEAFRARVASFHAPGDEGSFRFVSRVVMGGKSYGTCVFTAEAVEQDGRKVWSVRDELKVTMGDYTMNATVSALLTARLSLLQGREVKVVSGDASDVRWRRTEAGIRISRAMPAEGGTQDLAMDREALNTYAAMLLFCRLAPLQKARYAFTVFDANPDEGEAHTRDMILRFVGIADWHGRTAYLVEGKLGGDPITFAFDPESRSPLGFRMGGEDGGLASAFLPEDLVPETPPEAGYAAPAATPLEAGLATALALASGDAKLLEQVVHWPTFYASFTKQVPDNDLSATDARFRRWVIGKLLRPSPRKPRDLTIAVLEKARPRITVEEKGEDRAVVTFPESAGGFVLQVGKLDGSWFLVDPNVK